MRVKIISVKPGGFKGSVDIVFGCPEMGISEEALHIYKLSELEDAIRGRIRFLKEMERLPLELEKLKLFEGKEIDISEE